MKLLSLFSDKLYSRLLDWIYKFSRNTKVGYRVFALDIVAELLNQPLRSPEEGRYWLHMWWRGRGGGGTPYCIMNASQV